jgi:hypothetical protein
MADDERSKIISATKEKAGGASARRRLVLAKS